MKVIENKTITVVHPQKGSQQLTYGELIISSVEQPSIINGQPQGLDYETLKSIKRVDDVLSKGSEPKEFSFEDADFEFIKSKISVMKWGFYSDKFLEFMDYIKDIK